LVVSFPIDPTVVSTGGIAVGTVAGIPTHSTTDGELLLVRYQEVVLIVVCIAVVPVFAGGTWVIGHTIVPTGTALPVEFLI
jgi:hypothetical protein